MSIWIGSVHIILGRRPQYAYPPTFWEVRLPGISIGKW